MPGGGSGVPHANGRVHTSGSGHGHDSLGHKAASSSAAGSGGYGSSASSRYPQGKGPSLSSSQSLSSTAEETTRKRSTGTTTSGVSDSQMALILKAATNPDSAATSRTRGRCQCVGIAFSLSHFKNSCTLFWWSMTVKPTCIFYLLFISRCIAVNVRQCNCDILCCLFIYSGQETSPTVRLASQLDEAHLSKPRTRSSVPGPRPTSMQ